MPIFFFPKKLIGKENEKIKSWIYISNSYITYEQDGLKNEKTKQTKDTKQ